MTFLKKHKGKIFILIFILFTLFIVYDTYYVEPEVEVEEVTTQKKEDTEDKKEETKESKVLIDVKGEINTPGVYELTSNNTVMDVS